MSARSMETVLPPWTAVKAQATEQEVEIGVWGRTYRFGNAPLPTGILSAGEELLSSPVRLVGSVDGETVRWESGGATLFRHDDAKATVSGWQGSPSLIVNTTSQIHFDGLVRVNLVLIPRRGKSPEVDRMWLEIPLRPDRATLYTFWPGQWGSAGNSGGLSPEGLRLPFKPFVWLGWEAGGLSWFAESSLGWNPADARSQIEVAPGNDEVVLRLRLLDGPPTRLPLTLTFGLQATPVKPIPADYHEWRICHGAHYGIEKQPAEADTSETTLDRMARQGVRTLVFHESWTPIQNHWETTREAEITQLVSECHRRGIKLLLYFGYELSTLAPEWGDHADSVLVKDPQGRFTGGYERQPDQRDYIVCYQSSWADRLLDGIAWALDRYGFDGIYLDGTTEPWGCANEAHGCGHRGPDGSVQVTYPIFAVRSLMHRLYALIHPRGGLVNVHQSTCCVTPTLAFCDSYWDGEQFQGGELSGDPLRKLPLEAFRAEFMGTNFGVPCEFLVYSKPPGWTFEHALAFTLLHDVRVRPGGGGGDLDLMSRIWEVLSEFGQAQAEWRPYWSNSDLVEAEPGPVKVSLYRKKDQALLVAANLSAGGEVEARVTLKFGNPEGGGGFKTARDALSGEALPLEGNVLRLSLPAVRMRLVRLSP